ncbi:hypothetical protein HYT74_02390 [Candidatus Daviesbacteria bacterium]|nr:hypothetical protein [Candidatus Daviesbacteria bacterium]
MFLPKLLVAKKTKYKLASVIDLILIALILITGKQPAQTLISPFVSSLHSFYTTAQNRVTHETFVFVPGLAQNKFSSIDLAGLTNLSFFDVPITEDGQINRGSRGYLSFSSDAALQLFDRARLRKTKIFLTLSALDKRTVASFLDNPDAQNQLAGQAVDEIKNSNLDGITIDFELPGGEGSYSGKFTKFISTLNSRIHADLPQALVAVAVPSSSAHNGSFYNTEALSKNSDRIFLIASNFIVPEVKNEEFANPLYGYNSNEYWTKVSNLLNEVARKVSASKLVMERAWYGSGDNYPLYNPTAHYPSENGNKMSSDVAINNNTIEKLVEGVPDKGKQAARENIPLIARALDAEGILDSNVLAYALATVEHETDETFAPIGEIQGAVSARRLGYEGGADFFGRGFIQITHLRNYRTIGERIGLGDQLAKNPELASRPEIAAKILAAFFKDNNVANLASQGLFIAARRPINPDYNGYSVANLAMKYEAY